MKEILVKIKNLSIITIIASFVIGIVLLAWPDKSITVVAYSQVQPQYFWV